MATWDDFLKYFDEDAGYSGSADILNKKKKIQQVISEQMDQNKQGNTPLVIRTNPTEPINEATGTDLESGSTDIPNERTAVDPNLIGEYTPFYRDPDTGTRYEGSAKTIRDKIVADKMAENEASGKYNKTGLFKKFRGNLERQLDKTFGGDWDPWEADTGSIRGDIADRMNFNERQFYANEGLRLGEISRGRQEKTSSDAMERLMEFMEKSSGGKGLIDTPGYLTGDPPETDLAKIQQNVTDAHNKNKKKYNQDPESQRIADISSTASDNRINQIPGNITPGQSLENNQTYGKFTGRFKGTAGDGTKLTFISDDENFAYYHPKSGLLYDENGDTVGYSSAPGKYHFQPPDKNMSGWGINIGDITNKELQNKESGIYQYGGKTPAKSLDPGAYFKEHAPDRDSWTLEKQIAANNAYIDSTQIVGAKEKLKKKTSNFTMEQGPDGKMHKKYKTSQEDEDISKELERVARAAGWDGVDSSWITDPLQHDIARIMASSGKPYHPMDLGGKDQNDKRSYWEKLKSDDVGPGSWGYRGRPYNPYARKGDKSLGHKKIKEPAWVIATRKYYEQRKRS